MKDLTIRYDGQTNQIDANTFINSLLQISLIIQEVNKELYPEKKVNVKINALREGSFVVDIILQSSLISDITDFFSAKDGIAITSIIGVIGSLITIKQFLKKDAPTVIENKGDDVIIVNGSGNKTIVNKTVFNIYKNNTTIQNALSDEFSTLNSDSNISSFEMFDANDRPLCNVSKDEFYDLSEKFIDQNDEINKKISVNATLNIVRLPFEKNVKWEFYYQGNKISSKMEDDDFYTKINNGERFAKGDSLDVNLEINQQFDISVNAYVNKSYTVKKVIKHIPRGFQTRLNIRGG